MKEEQLFIKEFFIAGLISRKLCTMLSTAEATILAAWEAEDAAQQQLATDLTDIDLIQQTLPEVNKYNAKAAFERVTARIRLRAQVNTIANTR